MKHLNRRFSLAIAALLLFSTISEAQLIRGNVKSKHLQEGATLIYNGVKNGGVSSEEYIKLKFDVNGNFTFDDKYMEPQYTEATIYLGDYSRNGIFLQKGKTAIFTAVENNKKEAIVTYSGDNIAMSKFSDLFINNFELEHYVAFEETDVRPYAPCMAKLSKCYKEIQKALPKIKDSEMRAYYTKYARLENLFIQLRILGDTLEKAKIDVDNNPQYQSLLKQIDVNEPLGLKCTLPQFVIYHKVPKALKNSFGGDMTDYALAYIAAIKQNVTNNEVKKALADDVAHEYFSYGKGNNVEKFWPVFEEFVGKDSKLAKRYLVKAEATKNTVKGKKAPETTFSDAEGNQHKLSDYFGKLTYIDVWATWCVPCCKEIPYLEKLVEHYKGNDNIQFISISVDSNHDAWLAKLKKDKPAWKQFNLNREEDKTFSKAWNINGIPRFIIIDKDGNIYDADAIRPSDKDIITTLDKLIQ